MKLLEKYFSVLDKIDEKNRYYIFGGLLAFVFILDYLVLMGPQLNMMNKINPKIKVLSEDIKKAKADMGKVTEYREEVRKLKYKVDEINLKIKSKNELAFVLSGISGVANECGVKIDQIVVNPQDFELLLEKGNRKYYSIPIVIEARAGYHDFARFLNHLETDDMSIRVGTFTISATSDVKYHLIKLTLNVIVFEEQ